MALTKVTGKGIDGGTISTETAGTNNLILGSTAGDSIQSGGNYNTCIGDVAGTAITTGDYNVTVGYIAGDAITTGERNVVAGHSAGGALTSGGSNTAIGDRALLADTQGSDSVAIGRNALFAQNFTSATSPYNIAIGRDAGATISTGQKNTFVGGLAGDATDDGASNVAVGYLALSANCGDDNTAVGESALEACTGSSNVAVGRRAGEAVIGGSGNVLVGIQAGDAITSGQDNVIVGRLSGTYEDNLTTANGNVLIGPYNDSTDGTTNYAHGLGYNLNCAPGYTTLGLGSDDIRAAHGNTTWSTVSDERYKKDIVDSTAGLSFINALKPRTFKYKNLGELPETFKAYKVNSTDVFKNSNTNHGFIAQEVKTAIDADSGIKDGFKLWDKRADGSQEVAEAALIPILVKAVQELSTALDAAVARIKKLEDG